MEMDFVFIRFSRINRKRKVNFSLPTTMTRIKRPKIRRDNVREKRSNGALSLSLSLPVSSFRRVVDKSMRTLGRIRIRVVFWIHVYLSTENFILTNKNTAFFSFDWSRGARDLRTTSFHLGNVVTRNGRGGRGEEKMKYRDIHVLPSLFCRHHGRCFEGKRR